MARIEVSEFKARIERLRERMEQDQTDVFLVYGDEYRREHLRYVSNYWPLFERGMLAVGLRSEPILLVAPECRQLALEMSVWTDIRLIHEMRLAYIPEQIEYSAGSEFTTLAGVMAEVSAGHRPMKIKVCGVDAMASATLEAIESAGSGATVENGDEVIYRMRLIKSPAEVEALRKAWEICDIGYKAILEADLIGLTECQAAAIGEKAARDAGAESVVFSIFGSGERTNTVIGRASEKVIRRGEMIMSGLAVQYEGYVATDEWPFVAGGAPSAKQLKLFHHLIEAEGLGVKSIKAGVASGEVVSVIRDYFRMNDLEAYDLYPPIHGNGLAEAESPYPSDHSIYPFEAGMGINFDVSLFGIPGVGSNRIEEGFIVAHDGLMVLSKLIDRLKKEF